MAGPNARRAIAPPVDGGRTRRLIAAHKARKAPRKRRTPHAEDHRGVRPHRRGKRLRGAGPRQCARRAGPRHHQSRHRPARFPHAGPHRRGRDQGAARRPSRLHGGERHPAAARGGGGRPAQALQGRGVARQRDDHARRQADHVHVDPDVRRAGRGHPLSRSRLPDLSLDDRIHRRAADPGADPRGERLCLLGRGDAEADHAADAAADHQFAGQSDRRRHAEERGRQAGRRAWRNCPTSA